MCYRNQKDSIKKWSKKFIISFTCHMDIIATLWLSQRCFVYLKNILGYIKGSRSVSCSRSVSYSLSCWSLSEIFLWCKNIVENRTNNKNILYCQVELIVEINWKSLKYKRLTLINFSRTLLSFIRTVDEPLLPTKHIN